MKAKPSLPFQIQVAWSEVDQSYEARVPALRHCLAYGSTPEKAVKEASIAARAWIAAAGSHDKPIPKADLIVTRLYEMAPLLNVKVVAKEASIPVQTLNRKLKNRVAFTDDEAASIGGVFAAHGLAM